MTAALLALGAAVVALLARSAFRLGKRRDARRLPRALGRELRAHKLECLGEPQARVDLELRLLLGEEPARTASISDPRRTAVRRP